MGCFQLYLKFKNPVIEYIVDNKDSFTSLGIPSLQETVGFRRETTTLVEDIESVIRGTSPAPPSQHPTSTTTPNNEDSTPHRTDLLKTIDVARIYSDKTDEEEWPALPEIKYAPISPSLLNSTSSPPFSRLTPISSGPTSSPLTSSSPPSPSTSLEMMVMNYNASY